MKLKSLLLGSAAVLALSTGAQAADPIPATFVSLGVCDAYGISGLTIESDDTCLSISGEVSYEWAVEDLSLTTGFGYTSDVDWELAFEATTQTDSGAAVAFISFVDDDTTGVDVDPVIDQAYVQFGDTTVLSAGLKDSAFDTEILDRTYGGGDEYGVFDWDYDENDLTAGSIVAQGGHVITIESLVADGFTVIAGFEDLENNGTALLGVQYDGGMFSGEAAVLVGDLYNNLATDPVNFYAAVTAEFDSFEARAGVLFDDTGYYIASLGASATLDMFTLDVDAFFEDSGEWGVAGEGSFDATDTVAVYLGAGYEEDTGTDSWTVYGGVDVDVTEVIVANAELGYVERTGAIVTDYIYGAAGVTYAPGGGFETGLTVYANTLDDYKLTFEASKEF
ncbi:porin [Pelagibacterium sp.]|uniref:porin n=1 Tax=Pelagibacterium sp. TaxID=1967288 RepID=UPI003BABA5AB